MKLRDLVSCAYGKLVLYTEGEKLGDYVDIFTGKKEDIPAYMLDFDVCIFGVNSDFLDIRVVPSKAVL